MLKVSLSFFKSLADLPLDKIRKIPKFIRMLHENRHIPSLKFERLASADSFSARVDYSYRAILVRRADDYILLRVDKHDEAYASGEQNIASSEFIALPIESLIQIPPPLPKEERLTPPENPLVPKVPADFSQNTDLRDGYIYTYESLKERFDWDNQKPGYYLRENNGRIVCACLRAELNPSAPWEILVGMSESNIRQAELLASQSSPIPIFIKLAENQWEYWGKFRFERLEKNQDKYGAALPPERRGNTSMVIYLSAVE